MVPTPAVVPAVAPAAVVVPASLAAAERAVTTEGAETAMDVEGVVTIDTIDTAAGAVDASTKAGAGTQADTGAGAGAGGRTHAITAGSIAEPLPHRLLSCAALAASSGGNSTTNVRILRQGPGWYSPHLLTQTFLPGEHLELLGPLQSPRFFHSIRTRVAKLFSLRQRVLRRAGDWLQAQGLQAQVPPGPEDGDRRGCRNRGGGAGEESAEAVATDMRRLGLHSLGTSRPLVCVHIPFEEMQQRPQYQPQRRPALSREWYQLLLTHLASHNASLLVFSDDFPRALKLLDIPEQQEQPSSPVQDVWNADNMCTAEAVASGETQTPARTQSRTHAPPY
mmetsp:Transcript_4894/g.11140  ORF Transcript_4894/g.11140 Transcript_4894/m.11140 type:complete len:336 (+) Transcript_4894:90-1097(+)